MPSAYRSRFVELLAGLALFCAALTASGQTSEPQKFNIGPAPAWVKPVQVDLGATRPSGDVSEGLWILLADQQNNVREQTVYGHFARKYLTPGGVQDGSTLTIDFDPTFESLFLHYVVVHRGSERIDKLKAESIKLIQREPEADRHIYDGSLSATLLLDDIRVGDVVEYAFSIIGSNPVLNGIYADSYEVGWGIPVHRLQYRLVWPAERRLQIKNHNITIEPAMTTAGDTIEYEWSLNDTPAVSPEDRLPAWFDPYPWIQLSEFDSWAAIAQWADRTYAEAWAASPELDRVAEDIRSKYSKPSERFSAAIRFVQDEIRYLGLEMGPNSLKPHPADFVLRSRFGDCKDKSVLLCALLRKLGIEANPALVHSSSGRDLGQWHPSPYAFDHVVVRATLDGKDCWVDPAMSFQRGSLDKIYFPNYGKALVIRPDTQELVPVRPSGQPETRTSVFESFTSADFKQPVSLEVKTVYSGDDADEMRAYFRNSSLPEVEKRYLNYYAADYPDMESTESVKIQDNEASNEITVTERYSIRNFWIESKKDKNYYASFYTHDIESMIRKPSTTRRTMPLGIDHPKNYSQSIRAVLPGDWSIEEDDDVIEDESVRFAYKCRYTKKVLTLDYSYQSRRDHIAPPKVKEHLATIDRIWEKMNYQIYYPTDQIPRATLFLWGFGVLVVLGILVVAFVIALIFLLKRVRITFVR